MCWKNTSDRYGAVHQLFHWVMALQIMGMLAFGLYIESLELSPDKIRLIGLHKSTGMLILLLVGLRLCWRLVNVIPPLSESMSAWQKHAANASHYLLYFFMFAMPLSGWLMSSAAGFPVSVYGVFLVPDLVEKSDELRHTMGVLHEYFAWALMALLALHVAAALFHHFIHKDNILRRMLPCSKKSLPPA